MKATKLMRFNATKQCHVDLLVEETQHLTAIKSKSQGVESETYQDPKVIATWTTTRMREDEAINKRNQELEAMYRDKMEALMRHIYLMKREIDQHRVEQAKVKELATNMRKEFEMEIKEKILSQENKIKQQDLEKNLYDMTTFESEEVLQKRKTEENKLKEKHTELERTAKKLREKIEERRKEYTAKNYIKLLGDYKRYKEWNRQLDVQSKLVEKEYFTVETEYRAMFRSE